MFLCKIFEQVEKKSSEHVDFVYGCGKQGTVMHKEVEKAIQCHREIEKEKKNGITTAEASLPVRVSGNVSASYD